MTESEIQAQVNLLLSSIEYREEWMADPVRNLCASIGIEKANVSNGVRGVDRLDALADALSRIATHCYSAPWGKVLDAINYGVIYRSEAWSVAVRVADALGKGVK